MILLWSPWNLVSQMFIGFADGTRKTVAAVSFLLLRVMRTETLVVISAGPGASTRVCASLLICLFCFVSVIAWNTVLMFAKYL